MNSSTGQKSSSDHIRRTAPKVGLGTAALGRPQYINIKQDDQISHVDMTKYFSEKEIAEIAAIVINMNVWTRLKLAQGQVPIAK